jgi:hypothetical protein
MAERRRRKGRTASARERAKRLGWRVDPPEEPDGGRDDGDPPVGPPRRRPPRKAANDGWGRQ